MREPDETVAFLNGEVIPYADLKLPVSVMGIVHGVAVTEMLRTFNGEVFAWDLHWLRLVHSANTLAIPLPDTNMRSAVETLVERNYRREDLGIIVSMTPGSNPTYGEPARSGPTCFAHTFELPGELWAEATLSGVQLAISKIQQVPEEAVPRGIKSRSRVNWYLADLDVRNNFPHARALVLDADGFVRETSTANVFAVREGLIMTPPEETVLPGVSRQVTIELARKDGFEVREVEFKADDLDQADELFVTSTPYSLLGVAELSGSRVGSEFPGAITTRLIDLWNEHVGLDIHAQLRETAVSRKGRH